MIAALQSSLSAKDMELEVNMKCFTQGLHQTFTSMSTENMSESLTPSTPICHGNGAFLQPCALVRTENILKMETSFENHDLIIVM